jgi:uncharacterized protein (DUF2141 family)
MNYTFSQISANSRCKRWVWASWMLVQLFFCSYSSSTEINWKRELAARIDGNAVDCAFAGGMEYAKPAFADMDGDGDPDVLVGDQNGRIRLFRNEGTSQIPRWNFVSDFPDSTLGERISPALVDIDADGDLDLFVGNKEGKLVFIRNDGNLHSPVWTQVTDFYASIDVGSENTPTFADIDADKDFDLFIGKEDGAISFYRNDGTKTAPVWNLVASSYDSIDVGASSFPFFTDLDADGDLDLLVGEDQGNINFYRNVGNKTSPSWTLVSDNYDLIDAGKRSAPALVDIDDDSDFDFFVGQNQGKIFFYRNDGSIHLPSWTKITEDYLFVDVGAYSKPALVDIDADGDQDIFLGEEDGNINFYRIDEMGSALSLSHVTESYFAIQAGEFSSPVYADMDGDGDPDLFIGKNDGRIDFYENIGTARSALWNFVSDQYNSIDVGSYAAPAFVDIDHDSDLDMFIGQMYGKLCFYRNDGTPQSASWTLVSDDLDSIDVGWYSVPTFGDLDGDGDFDLLVGNGDGRIFCYRNDGDPHTFSFSLITDFYDSIDVGDRATPILSDLDSDGDRDLFIGESEGGLHFYKNLTLNSIRGQVTDGASDPIFAGIVYLSGLRKDSTFTDSHGCYKFTGLPVGYYCVYRDANSFKYCFSPLEQDAFDINFIGTTDVEESSEPNNPKRMELCPNYPNPFNPLTTLCYSLPVDMEVEISIFNVQGRKIRELTCGYQIRGTKKIIWDGRNSQGKEVASGIYFCKLRSRYYDQTIKMVMLK